MKSRIAASTSRSVDSARRSAAIASMSWRWYAFRSFSPSSERPASVCDGPGQRSHTTPPDAGHQR